MHFKFGKRLRKFVLKSHEGVTKMYKVSVASTQTGLAITDGDLIPTYNTHTVQGYVTFPNLTFH